MISPHCNRDAEHLGRRAYDPAFVRLFALLPGSYMFLRDLNSSILSEYDCKLTTGQLCLLADGAQIPSGFSDEG